MTILKVFSFIFFCHILVGSCLSDHEIVSSLRELKSEVEDVKAKLENIETNLNLASGRKESTFFLGGGLPESTVVEVFQLSKTPSFSTWNRICRKRTGMEFLEDESDYGGLAHPVVANFETHLMICGGSLHLKNTNSCQTYDFGTDEWTSLKEVHLLEARYQAESVRLEDGSWWIVGGQGVKTPLKSTEIYDPASRTFRYGPDLPVPAAEFCFVKINASHFFFTSGDDVTQASWMFNLDTDTWMELPKTIRYRAGRSICGYVERKGFRPNEPIREIVLAGGAAESFAHRATEILDLESLKWRPGPPLPEGFSTSALFTTWENSFFIIGGGDNEMYEYVEELWVKKRETLKRKKKTWKAFLVEIPNNVC